MPMTEYKVSDIIWHLDSTYHWENRTDNFDASTLNWSYQGSETFERGRRIPRWTEV
jgi:hypothetical protein